MITQIIWLLTWPLLITISWLAIKWVLKKSEKNHQRNVRILVNGDPFWRFVRFDNISGTAVDASTKEVEIQLLFLNLSSNITRAVFVRIEFF